MRYLKNLMLDYVEIDDDDNLYSDIDLMQEDCVDAQYWKGNGYLGNPDICALPRPASVNEMIRQNSIPISNYDAKKIKTMPVYERKRALFALKKIRYPFPFHSLTESYLSVALISSYSSRRNGMTQLARQTRSSGEAVSSNIISCMDNISANVLGFSIVGTSGTGKSTAFDLACMKYPKVIRHNFDEGSYTQIPIIRLTAFANSNLGGLFLSFARQLDRLLDTGEDHLSMIQSKANLGRIVAIICNWIELYHIGVIAIDEIQFIDFHKNSTKSFENFLTITANTGVALVTIGTPEACQMWSGMLRIQRRVASTIVRADSYCKDKEYMGSIIQRIWKYQWLDETVPLTREVADAMYEESCGSIDLLTTLWMMMQFEALSSKKKTVIDEKFVRSVSEKHIKEMRKLLKESMIESEERFLTIRESLLMDIQQSAMADEEKKIFEAIQREARENIQNHYDRDTVLSQVIASISDCHPEYSELQIRKAFAKAEKEEDFKTLRKSERVQKILSLMKKIRKNTGKTVSKNRNPTINDMQRETMEKALGECMAGREETSA